MAQQLVFCPTKNLFYLGHTLILSTKFDCLTIDAGVAAAENCRLTIVIVVVRVV